MVHINSSLFVLALAAFTTALPSAPPHSPPHNIVTQTTCNHKTYTYEGLSGFGFIPANFRDKFGDTLSAGSSIALERKSWKKKTRMVGGGAKKKQEVYYQGTLWMLPDRGWNTNGTTAWQPRVHEFQIDFVPIPLDTGVVSAVAPPNLKFSYKGTVLLTDPSGNPVAGLDPTTSLDFGDGFPAIPAAKFVGDGFGKDGPGGTRVSLDAEGLVLDPVGGFWISDEYGPYVYRFDKQGKMTMAVRPPAAYIPVRNGADSFASNNPPIYNAAQIPVPPNPDFGRSNNQGFEGLTVSGDGKSLYVMLQSATIQDGGLEKTTNENTRVLKYDIADGKKPKLANEWAVRLPMFVDPTKTPKNNPRTAGQSEILALGNDQFFVLSRDGFGRGTALTKSVYRQIDIFDLSYATDLHPLNLPSITTNSTSGVLLPQITPALYCPFLSINNAVELSRFGLRNGGADDKHCLNEKWEGLAIMPVDGKDGEDGEWFVLAVSDNDFITQDGFLKGGEIKYKDASGLDLDSQALVFNVRLPAHSRPFPRGLEE